MKLIGKKSIEKNKNRNKTDKMKRTLWTLRKKGKDHGSDGDDDKWKKFKQVTW